MGADKDRQPLSFGLIRLHHQGYLAGLGLDIAECFRRVSSLACTILHEETSRYTWWVNVEENFFRTTIRHKDTKIRNSPSMSNFIQAHTPATLATESGIFLGKSLPNLFITSRMKGQTCLVKSGKVVCYKSPLGLETCIGITFGQISNDS